MTELEIKMMAKSAAADYLEKKIPMNDSIAKLAAEYDLNGHHIARLCEEANLDAYSKMYKTAGNGNFTIDLADQNKIVDLIKTAAVRIPDDYDMSYSDISELMPKQAMSTPMDKLAAVLNQPEAISEAKVVKTISKLAYYAREFDSAIFEAEVESKNAFEKLSDVIKVASLLGEDPDKAYIAAMSLAKTPRHETLIKQAFVDIINRLKARNGIDVVKVAKVHNTDAKGSTSAEQSKVTSDTQQPFIVNQEHPIVKHINTITQNDDMIQRARQERAHVVSKIKVLGSQLKNKPYVLANYDEE